MSFIGGVSVGQSTAKWAQLTGLPHKYFALTDSTNNQAKKNQIATDSAIELFLADEQEQGRGRGENKWDTPQAGDYLLSSWVFRLTKPPQPILSPLVGLAIYKAFTGSWPWLNFSLKAPNDIFLEEKKIAGILIENIQEGTQNHLIIGLGANIFSQPNLPTATSLKANAGESLQEWEFHQFLDRILLELSIVATHFESKLTEAQCLSLQYALNRNPNLKQKYTFVSPQGDLETSDARTPWTTL